MLALTGAVVPGRLDRPDLAVELGDEGQAVDDGAVRPQAPQELALERLPSPLGHAEGRVVQRLGRRRVGRRLPPDDEVVAHQYLSVIQWLLPVRKASR